MGKAQIACHHGRATGCCPGNGSKYCGRTQGGAHSLLFDDARILLWWVDVFYFRQHVNRLTEAYTLLSAADAGAATTHRPGAGTSITEQDARAVGVGFRPLAAELVEAVALAVAFVAKVDRKTTGIEMGTAPYLHGYVVKKTKAPPGQETLPSEVGEPILARWHVGHGGWLAWTSDGKNLWAVDWLKWPVYGQFWGQLVREHMRQKKRQQYDMRAEIDPATGHLKASIDAIGGDDKFQNGLDAKLEIKAASTTSAPGASRKISIKQTAPGRYEVDFPMDHYGSFLLHASLEKAIEDGKGGFKSTTVAESYGHVSNPYPREYLAFTPDKETLAQAAIVTGGKMDPLPKEIFDPAGQTITYHQDLWSWFIGAAIAVYLLDLVIRRLRIFDRKKTIRSSASVKTAIA